MAERSGIVSAENSNIHLGWLAQRCVALHPQLARPSRREIDTLQRSIPPNALVSGAEGEGVEPLLHALEAFFGRLALEAPKWREAPAGDVLPMLALLPGVGCRLIFARTPEGHWLIEGPSGTQQLSHFPQGSLYAPIVAPRKPSEDSGSAFAMFKAALWARKGIFVQAALAALLANMLALAASLYSMQVYDRVIPTQGIATLIVLTSGVLMAVVLELIVKMARSNILEYSVTGMDLEFSHKIFLRLLGIRMDQFPASVGTLSAQLRSYETIRGFASSATLYLAVDAPFAILFLGVIWMLAGIEVAAIPAIFFVIALTIGLFYRGRIARHAESATTASSRKLGLLVETVENAESLKAMGAGWQQLTQWDILNRHSVEDDAKIRRYNEQATYYAGFMQQASYILLVAAGAWVAATSSDLTTGGLVACSILSGRVLGPVGSLPGLIVQWAHAKAALGNLEKVFSLKCDNHAVARPLVPESLRGDYLVTGLNFTYTGRPETLAVKHLHIAAGEKVAILGPVGSGKSTLLKLLAGLYAPGSGRVLLDGLDIQQIARSHLSEHLGYCPQEVRLLAGTLRANLMAGLSGIEEEEILRACRTTGLDALVAAHPKGLDLDIAEGGSGVSGGQKQLIALTRLLLTRPDIWLLDEPTSAMDEVTEHRSLVALRNAVKPNQTMVMVTHRPALIKLATRLIVLGATGISLDGPREAVLERLRQGVPQAAQAQAMRVVVPTAARAMKDRA
ncbi:ATP-binding cassette subfamily C protein LapB [Azonexus fungiphilus]|uniref:ATP-binding cassette subfamily C protein LapB n=1 Tax=Azonexus fungiphilus TaxID=146940 RepID=A0A495WP39_9RHOO|nr:ATP-binding cassette domain-containing protein [Azonexus fungiphilus]RKT63130.1 ATP-binding cassette subfamily C protein LapB [Azonexus fungiphilus]